MTRLAFIDLGNNLVRYFAAVSRSLGPEIQTFFYCTKPKPRSIARRLGQSVYPETGKSLRPRGVSAEARKQILNDKILFENQNRAKLNKRLDRIFSTLEEFIEEEGIDAVFLWNGSGMVSSCAIYLARNKGLKTIYGENGYFHNTMQLDPDGVNQASSITGHVANDYLKVQTDDTGVQELEAVIDAFRNNSPPAYTPDPNQVNASPLARVKGEFNNLFTSDFNWPGGLNRSIPSSPGSLPERYIFIPFQVVKDSQLLLYSPLVGNDMEKFLSSCREAVKAAAPDYRIVVKLHPADVNNIDYSDLMKRYPDVLFLKGFSSNELIKHARLVITINSTVGVEALMHNKPVITLGDNFYNVPGVVHHVEALSELPRTITQALSVAPDTKKIKQLLYYLYHCYFTHGSWKNFSKQSIEAVAAKLHDLLATSS